MKKMILGTTMLASAFLLGYVSLPDERPVQLGEMYVSEVLVKLGDAPAPHQPRMEQEGVSAEAGKQIVLYGRTTSPDGSQSDRVSKHFVCTSCHNTLRDEPDLGKTDPEARLEFVYSKGLPFLQGSALYGVVDRRSFYNGDYEKKYGELVKPARNDLRNAIQLCATECAQGRALKDWEMESVLSYLWTIGLRMEDLQLSEQDLKQIDRAIASQERSPELVSLIHAAYLDGMPATFVDPPSDRTEGYTVGPGDPEKGKRMYDLSCLHCHQHKRYSFFNLDESKMTFGFLSRHIPGYSRYSLYQVGRYGTSPVPGKRAYMPHYTKEKMSDQMMEDLRAYIEQQAL